MGNESKPGSPAPQNKAPGKLDIEKILGKAGIENIGKGLRAQMFTLPPKELPPEIASPRAKGPAKLPKKPGRSV